MLYCRKAVSTDNVRSYLDQVVNEKDDKPAQRTSYKKLDFRDRRNNYKSLEFGDFSRSPARPIRNLEIPSENVSPVAVLDPSQLEPFEKNFYKLHPDTKDFPDVSLYIIH